MLEDQARDAQLAEHTLKEGGFDFVLKRVETEKEYLHELRSFRPQVILSDHALPAFDGFAALAVARTQLPDVPFIFVTGSLGEQMAVKALISGATDFVFKDHLGALPPAVHRALRQAEARLERRRAEEALAASEERYRNLSVELERRVVERTAEMEAANKELEAFSYSVSHDLRAPLRHIEGFVEILRSNTSLCLDEDARRDLQTIADSARQMGQLIDDLLAFSRTARADLRRTRVDLPELVTAAIRDTRNDLVGRDVEWVIRPLPQAEGDPDLLRQVFLNLISNALKYTRPRARARIEIGSRRTPAEVIVYVKDNGVGFEMRYARKLFGVFQRLHRAAEFEGSGIGLANVRRIIHRHGGRTWAEAEPEKGATFYFSLPRNPPPKL